MVLAGAVLALMAATAGLALDFEPALSWYFQIAWWSYVVAVDAVNRRLAGRSLLRDRPFRFLWLSLASVAWWTLFEALNLRLGNWYYVMDHPERWLRWLGGVVAFATVLPGIVETVELIGHLGWLRRIRVAPLDWTPGKEGACLATGAAFFLLPLLWPSVFFPLTWGSFTFLIEPWNRRHAGESFLRDLEQGEAAPLCRTLLAGLLCGGLWELWNYWARVKWIYTVPGFEQWKLFEMPLLGFLGFPPFAVECVVLVRFLHGVAERLPAARRRLAGAAAVVVGGAATLFVFHTVERVSVDSFYVPVTRLAPLPRDAAQRLASLGLTSPEKLARALETPEGRARWALRSGVSEQELGALHDRIRLVMHRGLGQDRALQLARLGVHSLQDLSRWHPDVLAAALRAQGSSPRDRFLERRVRAWFNGRDLRRLGSTSP
jgi:hypothetical protein